MNKQIASEVKKPIYVRKLNVKISMFTHNFS